MSLILRLVKGTPLTFAEGDTNLTYLEGLATSSIILFNNWTGSITSQFAGTASYAANVPATASYALVAISSSYTNDALMANTASYVLNAISASYSNNTLSASYAITSSRAVSASWAPNTLTGGTSNYIPLWTSNTTLTSSIIFQTTSSNIIIGNTIDVGHKLSINGSANFNNGIQVNTSQIDSDTRIRSLNDATCFFVDASTNKVGIGTSNPVAKLQVNPSASVGLYILQDTNITSNPGLQIASSTTAGTPYITLVESGQAAAAIALRNTGSIIFYGSAGLSGLQSHIFNTQTGQTFFAGSLTGSIATFTSGTFTSGIKVTGSISISQIFNLQPQNPLPTGTTGSLAASGSALYFHDGVNWRQVSLL